MSCSIYVSFKVISLLCRNTSMVLYIVITFTQNYADSEICYSFTTLASRLVNTSWQVLCTTSYSCATLSVCSYGPKLYFFLSCLRCLSCQINQCQMEWATEKTHATHEEVPPHALSTYHSCLNYGNWGLQHRQQCFLNGCTTLFIQTIKV